MLFLAAGKIPHDQSLKKKKKDKMPQQHMIDARLIADAPFAEGGMNFLYAAAWIIHATAPPSLPPRGKRPLLRRRSLLRHVLICISGPTIERLQGRMQMRWALGGNGATLDGWIFNRERREPSYMVNEKWKRVRGD